VHCRILDFSGALSDHEIDNGSNPKTVAFIKKLA
jgi:hypothetical protein